MVVQNLKFEYTSKVNEFSAIQMACLVKEENKKELGKNSKKV